MKGLIQMGHSVNFLGCRGVLRKRCTTQDAKGIFEGGITDAKKDLCVSCIGAQKLVKGIPGIKSALDIEDLLAHEDYVVANLQVNGSIKELINLEIFDVPVGRLSLYETILTFKLSSHNLTNEAEKYYRDLLFGSILMAFAANKIKNQYVLDGFSTHNSFYAHNQTLAQLLYSNGIKTYSLHCGLNFAYRESRLIIAKGGFKDFMQALIAISYLADNNGITKKNLRKILNHIKISSGGGSVFAYSSPVKNESVLDRLKIPKFSKVTLAILSSADEFIAAKEAGYLSDKLDNALFSDQFEWIKWLFMWAKENQDRTLVIRIHPREAPNRREKFISQSISDFEKILVSMPDNVRINWPEDNLSMYDFVPYVEAVLTSWSSAGKEFALLGIPVISYKNQNRSYPDNIHAVAQTLEEYDELLSIKYIDTKFHRSSQIMRALEWLNLEQFLCTLDLSFVKILRPTPSAVTIKFLRKIKNLLRRILGDEIKQYPYNWIEEGIMQKIPTRFIMALSIAYEGRNIVDLINFNKNQDYVKVISREKCVKLVDKFLNSNFMTGV